MKKIPKVLFCFQLKEDFIHKMMQILVVITVLLNLFEFSITKNVSRVKRDQNLVCGVPHQGIGLIVGGEVAKKEDFPW
jgi:hypothetical protein